MLPRVSFFPLLLVCVLLCQEAPAGPLKPVHLRCEYATNPLGVDVPQPRLFWKLEGDGRGRSQRAYQVLAASNSRLLHSGKADLWDTGKVVSDDTVHIPYAGRALRSSQEVFWKVRVWDEGDRPSSWSQPARWTMGLKEQGDWAAEWVSSSDPAATNGQTLMLRREFSVKPRLRHAVAHVSGLGHFEMHINGGKVGDSLLAPGWTKYDKTCLYETYDVTSLVRKGGNAVGLILGNGMYNVRGGRYTKFTGSFGALKAIAQIHLFYEDGTSEIVGTDGNWRATSGPITFSCVYGGEDYDARLEPRGWDRAGFDDSRWSPAVRVPSSEVMLRGLSCAAPPIRAFETLRPVAIRQLKPGVVVYDLGQNAALMPRLVVTGPSGATVRITPAELLDKDGAADRQSCGGGQSYWQYTLEGKGREAWFPKFFYHGCRYLQVECTSPAGASLPKIEKLEGVVVHSASPAVGEFECSSPLFNRTRNLVRWAQRSNMMSVMTDCPHREKLGWLEENHLNGPSLRYEFEMARLFTKVMNDLADSQRSNGLVPDIAPEYVVFKDGFVDSPEWGSSVVLVPWQQYQYDGDIELLRRYYPVMKRYVEYLRSRAANHIVSHGLGDWYDIGPKPPGLAQLTPIALTATAFYYYDTWILARVAASLGKGGEAEGWKRQAEEIRVAFNSAFYDSTNGWYATGSQTANAIPLVMGIAEPEWRDAVLKVLVKDVQSRGNAMTAGDIGYRYLLRALSEGERSDVIFDMQNQSAKPGYGYQLQQGATSLTEAWNALPTSSQNHFMLGQITEWFYHDVVGIECDPAAPGFKRVILNPGVVGDLEWVKGSYDSIRGKITSAWKRRGQAFELSIVVPPNVTATVCLPADPAHSISEGGRPLSECPDVRFVGRKDGRSIYEVGSGSYSFNCMLGRGQVRSEQPTEHTKN